MTKWINWSVVTLAICSVAFGCGEAEDGEQEVVTARQAIGACPPTIGHGDSGPFTFTASDGSQYNYYVYVGDSYDECSGEEYPLVLNFHGGGMTAFQYQDLDPTGIDFMDEFRDEADAEGAVLVWIDSGSPLRIWNNSLNINPGKNHVLMVDDFVAFAESLLVLDEDRIHAVGFSNGAMFTQHLATREPNVFASVVSIAGTSGAFLEKFVSTCNDPYDPACNWNPLDTVFPPLGAPRPFVDIYMLRGDLDPLVPPTGGGNISTLTLSTHVLPALTNPAAPGFSDYELWQFATACAILTTNVYANSTKERCTGLGAEVRHDIVYTMTHSPPTLTNASFNGPHKIAKFLWNHPK